MDTNHTLNTVAVSWLGRYGVFLIPLGIFGVLALFLYVGLGLNPRDIGSTRLDKPAPVFSLPKLENLSQQMTQEAFLGKVSLLNVWASWCVSCRHEHPLLLELARTTDIPIYGLNYKDKWEDAQKVLAETGNPYFSNAFDETGQVGIEWGVTGTPETFVIDQQGIVRYKQVGPLTAQLLQEKILPLIDNLQKLGKP